MFRDFTLSHGRELCSQARFERGIQDAVHSFNDNLQVQGLGFRV